MPRSLSPVFERFFDDAGLFSPVSRTMPDALVAHQRARNGPHGQLVGAFLCPLARLDELDACVASGSPHPPEVGVVGSGAGAPHGGGTAAWWRVLNRSDVVHLEAPVGQRFPPDLLRLRRYLELRPRGEVAISVDQVAESGSGARVRCGGAAYDPVPSSQRLAEVLVACANRRVAVKAAGGPEHPFRTEAADTPEGARLGFVNLLAAASAALAGKELHEVTELLDTGEEKGDDLLATIDRHARLVVSVAAPSLDTAIDHLRTLGAL